MVHRSFPRDRVNCRFDCRGRLGDFVRRALFVPLLWVGLGASDWASLEEEIRTQYPTRRELQVAFEAVSEKLLDFAQLHPRSVEADQARFLAAEVLVLGERHDRARVQWIELSRSAVQVDDRARALYLLADEAFLRAKSDPGAAERRFGEAQAALETMRRLTPTSQWCRKAERLFRFLELRGGGVAPPVVLRLEKNRQRKMVSLRDLRGKLVLLDFWSGLSSGQGEFEKELARDLGGVFREYPRLRGRVEVFGVNLDRDRALFEASVTKWSIPWFQAHDGKGFEGPAAASFCLPFAPQLMVIGPEGDVRYLGPDRETFFKTASEGLKKINASDGRTK